MTISMNSNSGVTGNWTLPGPSGAVIALVNGVGQVNPADVPTAIRSGWSVLPLQNWPGAAVRHLSAPPNGNWPVYGNINLPDGTVVAVVAGAAQIPIAWANLYVSYGWSPTPGASALD